MFVKFIQDDTIPSNNVWEIIERNNKLEAFYRKGILTSQIDKMNNITHDQRLYRNWKIFSPINDGVTHMPDAFPMIFYATWIKGYEMIEKIRDGKYIFGKLPGK